VLFERLVIDAGAGTYGLDFHERLTVITGVGQLEREGLVNELVGALGNSRSGVHLEMASDAGNRFAVFRPEGARHRVIAVETAEDVSAGFTGPDGSIDLLARAGLDVRQAKKKMRLQADDLHTASEEERYLQALARIEQGRLWDLAEKVVDRERHLDEEADATGTAPEDAAIMARIEELHKRAEEAQERHEQVRSWTLWVSFASIMVALPVAMAVGAIAALPFILLAFGTGGASLWYYRELGEALQAEEEALGEVGANSYLNFHLQRVNRLLSSDQGRARLMSAAEDHRAALAQWRLIAGEIPVAWALEHRDEIREAARDHQRNRSVGRVAASTPEVSAEVARDISQALLARLSELRGLGPGGESFPVILDDPLHSVPSAVKPELLGVIARASATQQIILLTEDPEIADWARVEAITGDLSIIEPAVAPEGADGSRPQGRPHVAA
jgi:hypothetical protein